MQTGHVDLHCHVLPALDDGPATLADTVELLRAAWAGGTRGVVATPHMFLQQFDLRDPERVRRSFDDCRAELDRLSENEKYAFLGELELWLGAENHLTPELLAAVEERCAITLAGSRYLLLEFPPLLPVQQMIAGAERIAAAGLVPVVAHVERYPRLVARGAAQLAARGCVLQINAASVLGGWGSALRRGSVRLLRDGMVGVVASDGHDAAERSASLEQPARWLRKRFGAERTRAWLDDNPRRIVANRSLQ